MLSASRIRGTFLITTIKSWAERSRKIMANEVDMNAALASFQGAYSKGIIRPIRCQLHGNLCVLRDNANGDTRFTFARVDSTGDVHAIVSILPAEPYQGKPCFALAYAVAEKFRGHGLAKEIVGQTIAELRNGFRRQFPKFYIEVVGFCRISERRRPNRVNCGARTQDESICSTSKGCAFLLT